MTPYLLMAALLAAAALWLTHPLWRRGRQRGVQRQHANVAAYRSRLAELESDVGVGVVPADEAGVIKGEMDARLLRDAAGSEAPMTAATPRRGWAALLLTLLVGGFAGTWYWQAGSWRLAEEIATAPAPGSTPTQAEIEGMVTRLATRLQSEPDDSEGWAMLGRSYFTMGRHGEAAKAYGKANTLTASGNAEWLVGEGEALAMTRERDLQGRPATLFDTALALEPAYGKALWYGALADAQAQNFERAVVRIQALLAQDLPDDLRSLVLARLDELRALSGGTAPGSSEPAAATTTLLTVQVRLDPALTRQLPAQATLFVFAKAADGPPMPLAVQKLPGARLPLTVALDDSMGMTPAMKLSQFERYGITARLSISGNALAASGDLEGSATASRGQVEPVQVLINRVVP